MAAAPAPRTRPSAVDSRDPAPVLSESEVVAAFRGAPHRLVDVGHSRLAYWRFGTGPHLVLVHGWPLSSATYRRIVPALAQHFTLHLFDLPGAGKTMVDADAPIEIVAHADTMRRGVDTLGLSRYALLAHDSGGLVARLLAAKDPRVTALVLEDTEIPGHTPWLVAVFALCAKFGWMRRFLSWSMRSRFVRRSPLVLGGAVTDRDHLDGDFHELIMRPILESKQAGENMWMLLRTLDLEAVRTLPAVHGKITVPTQLVWGSDDPFFPVAKARAMMSQFAGPTEFHEIPRARLLPHEDHVDAFVGAVLPFLRTHHAPA
jgi:haloalkane dehalogenase